MIARTTSRRVPLATRMETHDLQVNFKAVCFKASRDSAMLDSMLA